MKNKTYCIVKLPKQIWDKISKITLWIAILAINTLINQVACHQSHIEHIETHFSPDEPCTDFIIAKILAAKQSILVQAYVLTCPKIAHSLTIAHNNKVKVKLLVDKSALTTKGSKIPLLLQAGIPIIIDKTLGIAHNKIMIIDQTYVITGSFNWTENAQQKNAENIVIITSPKNNKIFKKNWYKRSKSGYRLTLEELKKARRSAKQQPQI